MNCEDISSIVDTGSFNKLDEVERRATEAHALSCRHCASAWAVHSQLASLRIPPMPAELSVRCQKLAASPIQVGSRPALGRLTLIGGLMVLAAAAAILAIRLASMRASEPRQPVVAVRATAHSALAPTLPEVAGPAAVAPTRAEVITTRSPEALPLLPKPDLSARDATFNRALQMAVDRHPELVDGPELNEGMFVGAVVMRTNGVPVRSAMRLIPLAEDFKAGSNFMARYDEVDTEMQRTLPEDAAASTSQSFKKHTLLPDGRALRANVDLKIGIIPDNYDTTRSSVGILDAVRKRHADLLLPADGNEVNRLTIFLTEDGSIEREDVEHTTVQNLVPVRPTDPGFVAGFAQYIASRLALDVGQIGLMGSLYMMEDADTLISDGSGNSHMENKQRRLIVNYAWPRRAGESAPVFGQFTEGADPGALLRPTLDTAATLAILKRQIPDAFPLKEAEAGFPTIVLTDKGELIRAGRVRRRNGDTTPAAIAQLAPGVQLGYWMSERVRDETGALITVLFGWEASLSAGTK